jgi:hypothetical protein
MPRIARIAAVQLNAAPAPVRDRLARIEGILHQCAQSGARLVVLPEVFNTGYEYSPQNYMRAESLDGLTAAWMRKMAAHYHIHLAGTFLRIQQNKIFNSMLLVAPDGREWLYNKNYPWMWERAYFQNGTEISVADTDLGKIGMLICWDVAHSNLWRAYSGKIELMLVSSCAPRVLDLELTLPDGVRLLAKNTGPFVQYLKRTSDQTFGVLLRRQSGFLGVPLAIAAGLGKFSSFIPNPSRSLAMLALIYPPLWKYAARVDRVLIETGYFEETYLAGSSGIVLERARSARDGFAISDVALPDSPPQPAGKPPIFGISPFATLLDGIANRFLASEYERQTGKILR